MLNARGAGALWDEHGHLIVRADLLTIIVSRSALFITEVGKTLPNFFGMERCHVAFALSVQKTCGFTGRFVEIALLSVSLTEKCQLHGRNVSIIHGRWHSSSPESHDRQTDS